MNDFELIIVDDASNDTSQHIIERYAEQEPRIKAIFHDSNCGIAKTFNDGIEIARGRFIAQQASDDIWGKDKLRRQLAVMEQDENLVVWSEGEVIDAQGRLMGPSFSEYHHTVSKQKSGAIFQELLTGNYIFGSSLLVKKSNLTDVRYDEDLVYMNDYKLVLDLARRFAFYYLPEPLVRYRIHGDNAIMGSSHDAVKRQRVARREWIAVHEDILRHPLSDVSEAILARIYTTMGYHYRYMGENDKAIRAFYQAIKYDPVRQASLVNGVLIFGLALSQALGGEGRQRAEQTK